jgi:hypothetical protein
MIREHSYHKPGVRIPIRKWEKVTIDPYGRDPGLHRNYFTDDHYRLEVLINGEVLSCEVRVPAYMAEKREAQEALREHIVNSLAHQIGAVIADEVRRSIV